LQMLFQWDVGRQDPARIKDGFWRMAKSEKATRAFADQLFDGVAASAPELDALIVGHADNWRIERISVIDRAILRIAIYEFRSAKTPPKVVLDEAVELAKTFSSENSPAFVNGILDAVLRSFPDNKASDRAAKARSQTKREAREPRESPEN